MFFVLEKAIELMGGAPLYEYCDAFMTLEQAQGYVQHRKKKHTEDFKHSHVSIRHTLTPEEWESWSPSFVITKTVAWPSGRWDFFAKEANQKWFRGFESHRYRHCWSMVRKRTLVENRVRGWNGSYRILSSYGRFRIMDTIASELSRFLEDFPDDWMYKDSWYDKYYAKLQELIESNYNG